MRVVEETEGLRRDRGRRRKQGAMEEAEDRRGGRESQRRQRFIEETLAVEGSVGR